jgi:hypothetical protein
LVGFTSGEGCFSIIINKSKTTGKLNNTRFCFAQSVAHSDYFYFVYDIFKPFCKGPVYKYNRTSKQTGAFSGLQFNTLVLPCFKFYYDLFYNEAGVKIVPRNIIDLLTSLFTLCEGSIVIGN